MPCNTVAGCFLLWHEEWCYATPWHIIFLPWHKEHCCSTKSIAMAQRALLWHKEHCHGTKHNAAACSTMQLHKEHGHSTKSIVVAWSTMPQHRKHMCSTKWDAMAQRIWSQHQSQTPAPPGYLDFPPKPFWFAVEGFWMLQLTGDDDTFSTCAHLQKVFCKTFSGWLLFCTMIIFKKSCCNCKIL